MESEFPHFHDNLDKIDEEFNNFMHKVNEVDSIVKKMASKDKDLQEIGMKEANIFLKEGKDYVNIDEETIKVTIKNDRTLINKNALQDKSEDTMSQEAFMSEVSKDAERRYKDTQIRKEKANTFKTQATKAFRRGEYERALTLYDKAIEQVKDSSLLYGNRSLCQMHLDRPEKAIEDAEKALYVNENSLRARLLLAKYHFIGGNTKGFNMEIKEAKERHKDKIKFIEDFENEQLEKGKQI